MADVAIAPQTAGVNLPDGVKWFTWTPLTTTNRTGAYIYTGQYSDITVQCYGTFGAAATVVIQGSNEIGTVSNPVTLTDPGMTAISFTAAGMESIMQSPMQIRPSLADGDGSTSITVVIKMCTASRR